MTERKGSEETRKLLKALLTKYPSQQALAADCHYSASYLSYLSAGRRTASRTFCSWVKSAHPNLKRLCTAVQLSKVMD
jgi:hypothetical protein